MSDRPVDPVGGGVKWKAPHLLSLKFASLFFFFSPFDTEMNEDILPALKDRQIDR